MRTVILAIAIMLCVCLLSHAVDEDSYVRLTADAVIALHKCRGDTTAMNRWISQAQGRHPEFLTNAWQAFETNVAANPAEKQRVYNRILQSVQSQGYKAHISSFGTGSTAIEIEN